MTIIHRANFVGCSSCGSILWVYYYSMSPMSKRSVFFSKNETFLELDEVLADVCITLLTRKRRLLPTAIPSLLRVCEKDLRLEYEWTKEHVDGETPNAWRLAADTTLVSSVESKNTYECGICLEEVALRDCVNCNSGHLFCGTCVFNHAKQVAYGQGRPTVDCLEIDCNAEFAPGKLFSNVVFV